MQNIYAFEARKKLSHIILFFILFIFALLIGFSEIFQTAPVQIGRDNFSKGPIPSNYLSRLETVTLKNRLGSFSIKRIGKENWVLTDPRKMPIKEEFINELINLLNSFKIIKPIKKDPLNLANYSFDKPLAEINLKTELEEELTLKMGLINPIDNSTFILVESSDVIYQVESPKIKLEGVEFSSLIDSRIFSMKAEDIKSFKIMKQHNIPYEFLKEESDGWSSSRYKHITSIGVKNTLSKILGTQAHIIIDNASSELNQIIENYLNSPLYTIEVNANNETITYKISNIVSSLPDLKIEKRSYFLMSASNRSYPYLIHKDSLALFNFNYKDLSENKLDKFIY